MTEAYAAAPISGGGSFRVGGAVSRIFSVYWRGFGKFTLLACTFTLPILLIRIAAAFSAPPQQRDIAVGFATIALAPLLAIVQGACILGAVKLLNGDSFDAAKSFATAAKRFWPLIGVSFCVVLAAGLGALLLVVPGVIVLLMFYVAGAACIVEKTGVFASLRRSRELTKDLRWPIFGVLLAFVVIAFLVIVIPTAAAAFAVVTSFGAPKVVGGARVFVGLPYVILAVNDFVVGAVTNALGGVVIGVIYHDLRLAKEGVDVGKLANVFD